MVWISHPSWRTHNRILDTTCSWWIEEIIYEITRYQQRCTSIRKSSAFHWGVLSLKLPGFDLVAEDSISRKAASLLVKGHWVHSFLAALLSTFSQSQAWENYKPISVGPNSAQIFPEHILSGMRVLLNDCTAISDSFQPNVFCNILLLRQEAVDSFYQWLHHREK